MSTRSAADCRKHREETLASYQRGVEQVIDQMRIRYADSLTLKELADVAYLSQFHFNRVFVEMTGVSPGRFRAAIRMQAAKRLLLESKRTVTDICFDVGYTSLGTFTRVFCESVGYAPTRFRQLSLSLGWLHLSRLVPFISMRNEPQPNITGDVFPADNRDTVRVVGLFPTPIQRARPTECVVLSSPATRFGFVATTQKAWHIFAAGISASATLQDAILMDPDKTLVAKVTVRKTMPPTHVTLTLRQIQKIDPPVLAALPLMLAEHLIDTPTSIVPSLLQRI